MWLRPHLSCSRLATRHRCCLANSWLFPAARVENANTDQAPTNDPQDTCTQSLTTPLALLSTQQAAGTIAYSRSSMTRLSNALLLLVALLLLLLPSPLDAGRVFGKSRRTQKEEEDEADISKDGLPSDWTRTRHARRLETHVDEDDVLHLLRHDPVEMTLEEANDWQHVKRKLSEAREKGGWFHRVEDAFVPPNSALRTKESRMDGDKGEEESGGSSDSFVRRKGAQQEPAQQQGEEDSTIKSKSDRKKEAEKEFGIFERARKKMMRD